MKKTPKKHTKAAKKHTKTVKSSKEMRRHAKPAKRPKKPTTGAKKKQKATHMTDEEYNFLLTRNTPFKAVHDLIENGTPLVIQDGI